MKERIEEEYIDTRFGFPVRLCNIPMMQVFGEWVPNVNANLLRQLVLEVIPLKPTPYTGVEVKFIRHALGLTMTVLGAKLGVSHVAVSKWEAEVTRMGNANERLLRLMVVEHTNPELLNKLFKELVSDLEELEKAKFEAHSSQIPYYQFQADRLGQRALC